MSEEKVLTKEIAEQFLKHETPDLSYFSTIDDLAAELLASHEGDLYLVGLTELSDSSAENLSKSSGEFLALDGLKSLSESVAIHLANYTGYLSLENLSFIDDSVASLLSKSSLTGIGLYKVGLSEKGATYLSEYNGQISNEDPKEWVSSQPAFVIKIISNCKTVLEAETTNGFESIYEIDIEINGEALQVKQHQTPSYEDFLYFCRKNNDWLPVDGPSLKYGEIIYKCLKSDGGIKELSEGDMVCWDDESGVYVN